MINKFAILLLLCLPLSACVPAMKYGNYVNSNIGIAAETALSVEDQKELARISSRQMLKAFSAQNTVLKLNQSIKDPFGEKIVEDLRKYGFSILEYGTMGTDSPSTKKFNYVIDYIAGSNPLIYRVSLFVGTKSLSRVYQLNGDTLYPAGSWIYKE
jgi:hypothetical protein